MRSPDAFIVQPLNDTRYDNIRELGDVEFIVNSSQEDHRFSNRYAIVEATPISYTGPISKGDTLLVHHNVFKYYYDMKGVQKSGRSYFKDQLFFIEEDQFFLYKKDDQWKAHGKYCFVKPVEEKASWIKKFVKEEPLFGTLRYSNEQLEKLGVKEGDEISFTPQSEYEFTVDGEKLYRMYTENITMVL
tara:strand:+ start:535 stop:1098 length:564 start_codon:yes stop_codon:yes gene_type:complete